MLEYALRMPLGSHIRPPKSFREGRKDVLSVDYYLSVVLYSTLLSLAEKEGLVKVCTRNSDGTTLDLNLHGIYKRK